MATDSFERTGFRVCRAVGPVLLAIAAISLAGCGRSPQADAAFNQAFDKSTHDSCVTSAISHQAPADAAERYCTCLVDQFKGLSVQEKQSLNPASAKVQEAVTHCKASAGAA
jgi:hypothetical protein